MSAAVAEELLKMPGDDRTKVLQDNVEQVGVWASQIDNAFDRVARSLADAGLAAYVADWIGFKIRWASHVSLSRDVASENVALLRRFDQVYLDVVEPIATEQDRQDAIVELQQFIKEHDEPQTLCQLFLGLGRDIRDFAHRLGIPGIVGVAVADPALAAYHAEGSGNGSEPSRKQNELADLDRRQEALPNLGSNFADVEIAIAFIREKLTSFAEIWATVRSDTAYFQEQLRNAVDALTNWRFKKQVQLARAISAPLQASLDTYASELKNRTAS